MVWIVTPSPLLVIVLKYLRGLVILGGTVETVQEGIDIRMEWICGLFVFPCEVIWLA